MLRLIRRAAGAALELVYPEGVSCALCGADLDVPGVLCPDCAERLPPPRGPACPACGRSTAGDGLCNMCREYGPAADRGFAAYDYGDTAQHLLLAYKFHDRTGLCELFAHAMAEAVQAGGAACDIDCVVSVPMHALRRFRRGYNQSALLAARLARALGRPYLRGALARPVRTRAAYRASGGPAERHENARLSYRRGKGGVEGRTVLLVDDILTSGATVRACAAILRDMGAAGVYSAVAAAVPE